MRTVLSDLKYIWLNMFVAYIPAWWLRKCFYRLAGMKIGQRCRIGIGTKIIRPKNIKLGDGCIINEYCHLDGRGGLTIGNETSISIYCKIVSASHDLNSNDFKYQSNKIEIHDHVFIGANAMILENTIIKRGAVIGASSVAKGIFDENKIYAGNPIKCIKDRNCLLKYELYHQAFFR